MRFHAVCVYVVGGGSYHEYEGVRALEEEFHMPFFYGCDFMFSPEEFVSELESIYSANSYTFLVFGK